MFYLLFFSFVFLPVFALAQSVTGFTIINMLIGVIGNFVRVAVAAALVFFIWGTVKFISSDSDQKREEGKKKIVWGLVGLFVIVSIWGIVSILITIFGTGDGGGMQLPPLIQWGGV